MSDDQQQDAFFFDGWAVIEIKGFRKRAGKVRTQALGGTAVFVVECESLDGETLTEIYNVSSLHALTPCTEEAARLVGKTCNPSPVHLLGIPYRVQMAMARIEREEREKAEAIEAGEMPAEHHDEGEREFGYDETPNYDAIPWR